jgi:putative NIF3 family GTP cyclohydrolase 1 type 2
VDPKKSRLAAARRANLIITHEPTFYTHTDTLDWLQGDEVLRRKQALLSELGMNIWRFHDHIHSMTPDLIFAGMQRELGWQAFADPKDPFLYALPPTTVPALVDLLKARLGIETVRVVGDLQTPVERVALLIGGASIAETDPMLMVGRHDLDVIVAGEILEWTLCAYMRDAAQLGLKKALIVAGHDRTEEAGMKYLPEWLSAVLPGIPSFFVESGDPYRYL